MDITGKIIERISSNVVNKNQIDVVEKSLKVNKKRVRKLDNNALFVNYV